MPYAYLIMDGQWGSTGKGLLAGYLAKGYRPDTVVCNFGPNAGHTFVDADGNKMVVCQLPNGIVSDSVKRVLIGPGSIIDPKQLAIEIERYRRFLNKELMIHPRAVVVHGHHKHQESLSLGRISSTQKGTGAALASKIMREEGILAGCLPIASPYREIIRPYVVTHDEYMDAIFSSTLIQIESAQGLELGINSGSHYPFCTSRDIIPEQILADTLVPHRFLHEIAVSLRTYPIRVGNQFDIDGNMVGTSGPVHPDQVETSWEELGLEKETTTVTGKVRRVFTFSEIGLTKLLKMVQPQHIFLNFTNYLEPNPTFETPKTKSFVERIDHMAGKQIVRWIGTGPREDQIIKR